MKAKEEYLLSLSIVSHGQLDIVLDLLADIEELCADISLEVLLTLNIAEAVPISLGAYSYPITLIENDIPKGFGQNHNQAFQKSNAKYFCVLNPDIRLIADPFPPLMDALDDLSVGVAAPLVLGLRGEIEDSARRFPSPFFILKKALGKRHVTDYEIHSHNIFPDWVGGMFMLFKSGTYQRLNGFDERYFLYYEDVDLCARLHGLGLKATLSPASNVIHSARRTSHRKLKYLRWHITSLVRFFLTHRTC